MGKNQEKKNMRKKLFLSLQIHFSDFLYTQIVAIFFSIVIKKMEIISQGKTFQTSEICHFICATSEKF